MYLDAMKVGALKQFYGGTVVVKLKNIIDCGES